MFFQRILAWALLALGLGVTVYGIATAQWFSQQVWLPEGAMRYAGFTAAYVVVAAVLAWFAPRWLVPALLAGAIGYSLVAAGPRAVAAVITVLLASYVAGAFCMRKRPRALREMPAALLILGVAVWITFLALTARFPIHYWPVYFVLFAGLGLWAWSRQILHLPAIAWPVTRTDAAAAALPALPLLAHWLAALKPETGAEALGIGLTVPARIAAHHFWPFDVQQFAWAVQPLGAGWALTPAYLLGGEAGARLWNVVLLGVLCWLLYGWLSDLLPTRLASLITTLFASLPLSYAMAGSLQADGFAAVLLAGTLFLFRRYLKSRVAAYAFAAAFLTGVTATVSYAALGFALAVALAACLTVDLRVLAKSAPLALGAGLLPYIGAWWRTGNPVFPHLNDYFGSQLLEAPLAAAAGPAPLSLSAWLDLTFHSSRYLEGLDGAFGFAFLVLAPLCVIAMRDSWPRIGFVLLGVWTTGFFLAAFARGPAAALFPGLPVLTLSIGIMTATFRLHSPGLLRALTGVLLAAVAVQLYFLPAAAPQHRDFALNQVFEPASIDAYLERHAPERPLVRELNRLAPSARVAWIESNATAGFAGAAVTNTWHHPGFQQRVASVTSTEGLLFAAKELELEYFIAPTPESPRPLSSVFTREFLDLYTEPQLRFGDRELRKFKPPEGGFGALQLAYAPAGTHDDVNSYVRFEGPWHRDLSFPDAYRGTLSHSNDLRARVFIRFQGRAITPLYTAAANRCAAVLSLDDAEEIEFNQYSGDTRWQARGPRVETAPGYHTLILRLPQTRTTTTSESSCFLDLDGFIVE